MAKSASLWGLLGLLFLAFGFGAIGLVGLGDPYVLMNLVAGVGLLVAYLAFGFEGFRSLLGQRSTRYGASAAVYTLLFVALVVGANYLSARRHHRWDLTEGGVYTLAPQSKKMLADLKDNVTMTAFVEGGMNPGLESLLDSYRYANPAKLSFRMVDPDKEPALVEQMKITTAPSVHLQYGKESFVVTQPSEETITNGLIRVTRATKKVVYFAEGNGEAPITDEADPKGYAAAKLALEQENYEVKTLLLPSVETVPDDASVLIVAGVGRPFSQHELDVLQQYLRRGGHLLLAAGPRQGDEKMVTWLEQWGVKLGNDVVIDKEVRLFEGPRLGVQPLVKTYGAHPIVQNFRDITIYPQTRTVEPDATGKKGITATALAKTSPSSWAETGVEEVFTKGTATPDNDRKGPLTLAVAVAAKLKEMGLEPAPTGDEARLVIVGTPSFGDNERFTQFRLNGDLFLNAVGWLVGQEELVSVRSRTVRASRAELTADQAVRVFYLSVLIIPQMLIALGIAVWWRRRSA